MFSTAGHQPLMLTAHGKLALLILGLVLVLGGIPTIGNLLSTGSEEKGVLGVGSIPVAILPSCQHMEMLHNNCIDMNKVG